MVALTFDVYRFPVFIFNLCVLLGCRLLFNLSFDKMDDKDSLSVEGRSLDKFGIGRLSCGSSHGHIGVFGWLNFNLVLLFT